MPQYINDILSLKTLFPELNTELFGTNISIDLLTGETALPEHRMSAIKTAKAFRALSNLPDSPIRDEHVNAAELRVTAIGNSLSNSLLGGQDVSGLLNEMNERMMVIISGQGSLRDDMGALMTRMSTLEARHRNSQILSSRNANPGLKGISTPPLLPLVKTVPGWGTDKLRNVLHVRNVPDPQDSAPMIGDVPEDFNADIFSYTSSEINRMVSFYNETFGIVHGEGINIQREKFRRFLCEYH